MHLPVSWPLPCSAFTPSVQQGVNRRPHRPEAVNPGVLACEDKDKGLCRALELRTRREMILGDQGALEAITMVLTEGGQKDTQRR